MHWQTRAEFIDDGEEELTESFMDESFFAD
jgi:hypothetical protein